ncbi:RNA polymerase subunit sigma [Anaerobacillus alkalilacustris]|uniref:RNA polymerase subunit sigma n=1 Tax=Anaerobacillus alkalilacustris TaxID=393763 RepID=A0A1S2LPA4_9BACI|nr:sigma-70 family RNA polymerase sigma factor [Anaerobacillus alkalilacustris]OIJ14338.1 RNA polymerase subunit sigma [Anaerobacillus alkalilacustris]
MLIKQILAGNDHAFRLLVQKYRNHIYKIVYSVLRNEKDAEDAAQEAFIKIYSSLPKYEGKGFKTWMTRIALNHSIDTKRKRDRMKEEVKEEINLQLVISNNENIEDELLKKEKKLQVQKHINELPKNYRDVVQGFYIQEKSFQQLASEQGVKEKSIEVKLHRARKWMKARWKEENF